MMEATTEDTSLESAFNKWTSFVSKRFHRSKGKSVSFDLEGKVPIVESVFESAPNTILDEEPESDDEDEDHGSAYGKTLDDAETLTSEAEFTEITEVIRDAMDKFPPRLNPSGSSGSYFVRDGEGQVVGIFKPKDEEPYGSLNPKWTKWFHRVVLTRILGSQSFGRSCLIPNLSYLSESCASLLDRRLGTNIVPRTEVVAFSSPSFYYDWIDRERANRKGKLARKLPDKKGSLQLFLKGYQDASLFLRLHPWPGRALSDTYADNPRREKKRNFFQNLKLLCGRRGDYDEDGEWWTWNVNEKPVGKDGFVWTDELIEDFRIEMEKLVILDIMIRNTDRGLDNFMIKYCPPSPTKRGHIHLAAIDNSLAFPHQHPSGYRSYAYGWLWLPVSLIGQPFTSETRRHFIPLLESKEWWTETVFQLRKSFEQDEGFNERLFAKQISVVKGQGLSVLHALRNLEHGPIELCAGDRLLVHDEIVEVPISNILPRNPIDSSPPSPKTAPAPLSRSITSVLSAPQEMPSMRRSTTYVSSSVASLGRSGIEWNSFTGWEKLEELSTSPPSSSSSKWVRSVPIEHEGGSIASSSAVGWKSRPRRLRIRSVSGEYSRIPNLETVGEEEHAAGEETSGTAHSRSKSDFIKGLGDWEEQPEEGKVEVVKGIKESVTVVTAKPYFASC